MAGSNKSFRPPATDNPRDAKLALDRLNKKVDNIAGEIGITVDLATGENASGIGLLASSVGLVIAELESGVVVYNLKGLSGTISSINGSISSHSSRITALESAGVGVENKVTKAIVTSSTVASSLPIFTYNGTGLLNTMQRKDWENDIRPTVETARAAHESALNILKNKVNEIASLLNL